MKGVPKTPFLGSKMAIFSPKMTYAYSSLGASWRVRTDVGKTTPRTRGQGTGRGQGIGRGQVTGRGQGTGRGPDLLTLPKYNGNFWRIFRKLKKFWHIFANFEHFWRIFETKAHESLTYLGRIYRFEIMLASLTRTT